MDVEQQRTAWRCSQARHRAKPGAKEIAAKRRNKEKEAVALRLRLKNPIKWLENALTKVRHRAKARGLEFSITVEDVFLPTDCPVFGTPLVYGMGLGSNPAKHRNVPSLDRIDNSKGYVKGNIAVISNRANLLKKDGTYEELKCLTKYMEAHHHNNLL